MIQKCNITGKEFEVTEQDLNFYKKMEVPSPQICPDERQRKRAAFRNERSFYHRKCHLTGKQIISLYSADKPYKVYTQEAWWSDKWNPLDYGQEFDFNRGFFEQFQQLMLAVPRANLHGKNNENSIYTTNCDHAKNSYMGVSIGNSEDIIYGKWILDCRDCIDNYQIEKSELCYECLYSVANYNCSHLFLSDQCSDSNFLYDCRNCNHCLMCYGLRNKKFCIENKQYSQQEYEEIIQSLDLGSNKKLNFYKTKYQQFILKFPHKTSAIINSEDCSGDFIYNCKNVKESFDAIESQDCKFLYNAGYMKDCYDVFEPAYNCELQYNCYACNRGVNIIACSISYDIKSSYYCDTCHNSSDLFGCIGLRHKQYCILNKQYSKEKYFELKEQIIEHMKTEDVWGEFFPTELSPFAYNESDAQYYYPLSEEEAISKGYKWLDFKQSNSHQGPNYEIPDNITDVKDEICSAILQCEVTGKLYKVIPQELRFYKKMQLSIPRKCPDQRYKERMSSINPRKLWNRKCDNCELDIQTTFAPDRPERIYCEKCYLNELF